MSITVLTFLSEIRLMAFDYAPSGWAMCNGQLLPINQNQPLFSLLGTTFGGNGQTNFALPDLRGRVPIHVGSNHTLGERAGESAHTITSAEMPMHTHAVRASSAASGGVNSPAGNFLGGAANAYGPPPPGPITTLQPGTVTNVGGSQAHQNMQPYLTLNYCIALQGIFPSPN